MRPKMNSHFLYKRELKKNLLTEIEEMFNNLDVKISGIEQSISEKCILKKKIAMLEKKFLNANVKMTTVVNDSLKNIISYVNLRKNNSFEKSQSILKFIPNKSLEASNFNSFKYVFRHFANMVILTRLILKREYLNLFVLFKDNTFMRFKYLNNFEFYESLANEVQPEAIKLIDLLKNQSFYKYKKIILDKNLVFFFIEFQKRQCVMQIRNIMDDFIFITSDVIILKLFEKYQIMGNIFINNLICL